MSQLDDLRQRVFRLERKVFPQPIERPWPASDWNWCERLASPASYDLNFLAMFTELRGRCIT
jgi:hypothetical protein